MFIIKYKLHPDLRTGRQFSLTCFKHVWKGINTCLANHNVWADYVVKKRHEKRLNFNGNRKSLHNLPFGTALACKGSSGYIFGNTRFALIAPQVIPWLFSHGIPVWKCLVQSPLNLNPTDQPKVMRVVRYSNFPVSHCCFVFRFIK